MKANVKKTVYMPDIWHGSHGSAGLSHSLVDKSAQSITAEIAATVAAYFSSLSSVCWQFTMGGVLVI